MGLVYVGTANAILLAQKNSVYCHDLDHTKLDKLKNKISPIQDKEASTFLKTKKLNLFVVSKLKELKKNLSKFQTWDDINQSGVTVAVTLGTTQEMQAKSYFPNASIKSIESPARDFQEVLAGRADAHITSNVEAATLVETYPELAIVPVQEPKSPTPLAWLVDQNDQVWINYINHWIELKKAQGFFDDLMNKWNLKSL